MPQSRKIGDAIVYLNQELYKLECYKRRKLFKVMVNIDQSKMLSI